MRESGIGVLEVEISRVVDELSDEVPHLLANVLVQTRVEDGVAHDPTWSSRCSVKDGRLCTRVLGELTSARTCACLRAGVLSEGNSACKVLDAWWRCREVSAAWEGGQFEVVEVLEGVGYLDGARWLLSLEVDVAERRGVLWQGEEEERYRALEARVQGVRARLVDELTLLTEGEAGFLVGMEPPGRGGDSAWEVLHSVRGVGGSCVVLPRRGIGGVVDALGRVGEVSVVKVSGEEGRVLETAAGLWEPGSTTAMGSLSAALDAARRVGA